MGFAQPRHRAVRIERNGVSVNASVERRESISNASMLVSSRSLCQNAWFCILKLARRKRIKSFEKMHSRTPTNEQEHCDFFFWKYVPGSDDKSDHMGKRDKRKNVIFLRFRSLKKGHRNFKQILEKWAPMQVKLLFLKCPPTKKKPRNTAKLLKNELPCR